MKKEIPILVLLSLIGLSRAFAQVITYSTPSKIIHIAANDSSANFGDDPANYYYGASEYCVGHFNNDIYDDLVVLAPNWKNVNGIILGKAYIYYGSPAGISNTPSLEIAGVHDLVGFHTVLTGDFNNDSYDDLVLTAHNYQSCGGVQNGYAVVYFSKPDGTGIDALTFTELNGSGSCGINFGVAVAKGDVNGDGKTDLVVSAIHESGYSGRLYVYYGKSNFVNTPDKILSRNGSTILGICYLNCGDVNGDNFDDIISVDMPSWNENNKTLSVFPGGTSMNTTPAYTRVTGMYGGWTALGDINNDGIKDIIRSSHFCYGFGAGSSATINIIKGATNFDINNELSFTFSSGTTSMISFPVATGDVNNDGINDVFASILYPNGSKESFVFAGDAVNYLDINDTLIRFTDTDNTYGNAIENVIPADMNGDGKFEFYGYSRMLPYKGVIFVYGIYVLPPVATPGASCGPGLVSLTASGASGSAQYYWYSSDTSQTALATGPVFITPFISQNSTYYVAIDSSGVFSQRVPVQATINALPADIGQPGGFMPSLQNGLVAHYPMDGNANDASGNGNTGINHGATATAGHCGNAAGAMSFNGSSNWIEVPNSSSLQSPNTGFSMSSWVKSGISYIPFLCKINGPSYNIYQYRSMYDISSQGCWLGMNGTDYGSTITSPVSLNTWFHYTVTYDGSVIRYYINGVLNNQSNVAISINPNSQRLEIARDAHGPVEWLNGALDEMRIYNRALTSQEVVSLSAGCSGVAATLGNDTVCAGNNTSLNIQNSQSGIKYQVLQNGANYGTFQTGNGNTLTFPVNGLMQTASFTMLATNPATGCFIVLDSVFIVHVSAPDAVVSPPATICSGSNTTLTASGGLNYLWSNGATTAVNIVSPLATTNYHVTVTSPSGCTDVDSVTVTVIPSVPVSVTVTASANPVCQGDTVQYTAHMANAGSNAALQWYVNGLPVYGNSIINGLVAHYPFNGTLADATGNSQNAVEHGNVSWTTDRFGNPNSAYNIGGNPSGSDYLTVANSSALAIQNPFTVSVWVNKEVHGGWILNKGRDIINGYGMYDGGGNAQVVYAGNNGAYVTNTSVSLNQWHLYTCVFKGDSASFYLDGTLADKRLMASSSYVSSSPDYPLAIGRHFTYCCYDPSPSYWSYPFKGKVDDVRLYNRSLSAVEVWQLYKGFDSTYSYVPQNGDVVTCVLTATGTCLSNNPDTSNAVTMVVHPLPANLGETTTNLSQGLVAYYPFNGNANDESGNGNNGFVSGAIPATDRCGNANKAFRFDGINDVISTPVSGGFTNEITLCAWYKADGNQNNMSGIVSSRSGYYQENGLGVQNSSIGFWLVNDNGGLGYSVQLDYQWHFIAGTYKNGLTKLFYDNQLVASRNGIVNFTVDQAFLIGYDNYTGADRHFFGSLDKIQIYNRGLTDNEIANLYSESCYNLAASLSIDSICVGNNTSLNILHSQPVVNYQMLHNGANYGTFQTGNGNTLTFPINGLMQTTSFTVLATNTTTGCYTILDSTFTVHVSALNAVVSPAATICSGTPAILTASGGTGYLWSNGMTTPVITVSPLATTVYYVTVSNGTWCTDTDSVKVNVNPTPLPTITGTNSICLGAVNIAYTTQAGMTGYNWTVSAGGTITAGAGTNTITLTWNTLGSQTVGVNYTSILGCTAATPSIMNVTVNPMPAPVITGNGSMCVSSGYYDYATQTGMTNYTWSISPGGTILFGTGTNLVTVTWDVPGPQWLKVNYTNSSGCTATAPTQLNIMVNPLPGAAGTVLGSVSVCAGAAGVNYSTTLIPDAVTYVWSLPMGASIASGSGTNSILVDFGPNAQPGDVTVYGNNLCGNGTLSASLQVAVSALPGNAGTPTGEEEVCQGDTGVIYYVSPIANAVYYIWEITGGGVITTGNGTNSIRAKFPVGPATCGITVYASNACGAGLISGLRSVLVNALPPVPVVTQNGNQLVSSAPFGNQWYFNGILIAGADQATLTPDKSGAYSVIVTLSGCSSEASDGFFYVMTGTASPEPFSVKVYPVPNDGLFRVDLNGGKPELVRLSVLNGLGQKIYEHQGIELSGERQHKVDLRPVPPGVYTLILESGTYRVIRKIVVDGN